MTDPLDEFMARTQEYMDEAALERFGPKIFARWDTPRFMKPLPLPDRVGEAADPKHGDTVTLFLKLEGERVAEASFLASGCGPTIVCGEAVAELIQGKHLDEAAKLDVGDILALLETLPANKHRCATLAVQALKDALGKA
jgi:nitrogen fixation NifU-like protein